MYIYVVYSTIILHIYTYIYKVLLGGGSSRLTPSTTLDSLGRTGYREDNRNLIEEWLIERQNNGESAYVNDRVCLSL